MTRGEGPSAAPRDQHRNSCRVVTTSVSARLLLLRQLDVLREYRWTVVSGDEYHDAPEWLDVHVVPMRRDPAWSDLRSFWHLLRFFSRHRFEFIQTHTPKASLLALPAARLSGAAALYTVHGSLYFRGNAWLRNLLGWFFERWCCSWATMVLLQSEEDMAALPAKRICPSKKLVYIGNGIRLEHFAPQPSVPRSTPTVLMVSRLVKEKGCRDFFAVARRLGDIARFVHVGPPEHDQRDAIGTLERAEAQRCGVEFLGEVDDIRPHIAKADVVLLPSYREGLPRVAIEAAAMGRPVVGYDIRGMREVVPNGSGLLAPLADVDQLVHITRGLLMDPGRRATAGEASRRLICSAFSEDRVVARLRTVYAGLRGQ